MTEKYHRVNCYVSEEDYPFIEEAKEQRIKLNKALIRGVKIALLRRRARGER